MTPPSLSRISNSLFVPEENMCVAAQPEELVCRAPEPVALPVATPLLPDFRAMAHASYAQRLLERNRASLAANAFGPPNAAPQSSPRSIFSQNPIAFSGWIFAGGLPGCSHEALDDMPPPGDPPIDDPSDDENPPVNTGGDNGGLGSGILPNFATGECSNPIDLDLSSDANSLIMTCADRETGGNPASIASLERINASTGAVTKLLLPESIDNDPNRAVYLSSTASDGTGVLHVGFAADGSTADFTGGTRSLGTSGIFITPEADPNVTSHVLFNAFRRNLPGDDGRILLAGITGQQASVWNFVPNTPVSMTRVGDQLYALTRNLVVNPKTGGIDLAPATLIHYSVNPSTGALTPVPVTNQSNVINGTTNPHNAYFLEGAYNPTAVASTSDGRIVAVTQGIPGENASSLHVFNQDFTSGLTNGAGSSEIILSDAANPDFDFVASSSSQLTISGNYALVGSEDGSGRVAVVDVSAAGPGGVTSRTRFVKIFDDGSDIANIVANPNGQFAYVISDTGQIRALTLTAGANFGKVGDSFTLASGLSAGTMIPAAWRANSVIGARPLGYSKAPIN